MRLRVRTAAASGNRHRAIPTLFPASLTFEKMPLPAVSENSPFLGDGVARPEDNTSAYWNRMAAARELRIPDTFQASDVQIPDIAQDLQIYDVLHSKLTNFARQGERDRANATVVKAREILMKRVAYRAYGILTAEEFTDLSNDALMFEPGIAKYFRSLADATNSSMLMPPRP